jgi:hypothetical protein
VSTFAVVSSNERAVFQKSRCEKEISGLAGAMSHSIFLLVPGGTGSGAGGAFPFPHGDSRRGKGDSPHIRWSRGSSDGGAGAPVA